MQMPDPIRTFFDADQCRDTEALVAAFARDALVTDEGAAHRGSEAIGTWWQAAKQQYDHRAAPFEVTADDGRVRVRAKVSGNFPGSPATLTYVFRLEGDRIAELEIGA